MARKKDKTSRSSANAERNAVKASGGKPARRPKKAAAARKGGGNPRLKDPDFFSVHMRRLGTTKTAKAIYQTAPTVGADGLVHLQGLACQAQYELGAAYKELCKLIRETPDGQEMPAGYGSVIFVDATWRAQQLFAAAASYATAQKKLIDASVTVNRLWLDNELDAMISKLEVKTDNWRDAMAAYVDQVAAAAAAQASGTVH